MLTILNIRDLRFMIKVINLLKQEKVFPITKKASFKFQPNENYFENFMNIEKMLYF